MLKDGTLAGAAWTGYMRMPKFGLYRIVEEVLGAAELTRLLGDRDAAAGASTPAATGSETAGTPSSSGAPDDSPPRPTQRVDQTAN